MRAAAGGHGTVVVAWQRVGRIEARISRDRGHTYGPVRYLGPSSEPYPSLTFRVSAAGKVLVVWGARVKQGATRLLMSRAAIAVPGTPFATRVLERSAPLDLSTPQAIAQGGPSTRAAFAGETPIAAWQTVLDGRSAVRTARLEGQPMTATFAGDASTHAILDDMAVAPSGATAVAWSTLDPLRDPALRLRGHRNPRRALRRPPATARRERRVRHPPGLRAAGPAGRMERAHAPEQHRRDGRAALTTRRN